jgi:hypothetical protein
MTEPKTTATRQREWRARRKAEGHQQVTVWLDPETAKVLAEMVASHDKPKQTARQEIINKAIRNSPLILTTKVEQDASGNWIEADG